MQDSAFMRAVEHSITTTYRKTIWKNFVSAMKRYALTAPGDRIAVCVSGGKDSLLLAKCMQLLRMHSDIPFDLEFLCMDPGYDERLMALIRENAGKLGIPLTVFEAPVFPAVDSVRTSPCHVCAAMRRGYLYKHAAQLGCNKIALGHHFDDVVETILMSLLYGGEFRTMMPRLSSDNYAGMQLIRPLYLVRERYILAWKAMHRLETLTCACRVTKKEDGGKRKEIKNLIAALEKTNPKIKNNLFASIESVNLQTVLGYQFSKRLPLRSVLDQAEENHD